MAWKKLGMMFDLGRHSIGWLKSHAMLPTPLLLEDRLRVYFTGRDSDGHSRIGFVDLDRRDPTRIRAVHHQPVMDLGRLGTFDDAGTLGTCAVVKNGEIYLYYNGYNVRVSVPYHNAIGVAISRDGGVTFERVFEGPIVDRSAQEPFFAIGANVLRSGELWHMWYGSGTGWVMVNGKPESLYLIKYAHSLNGLVWQRDNVTCIAPLTAEEANVRAAVQVEGERYRMWFTFRGSRDFRDGADSYRIGYAESSDPVHWTRKDSQAGIAPSPDGWDSSMQTYPAVVTIDGQRYLFYNGNGFGAAGFGCAVWE